MLKFSPPQWSVRFPRSGPCPPCTAPSTQQVLDNRVAMKRLNCSFWLFVPHTKPAVPPGPAFPPVLIPIFDLHRQSPQGCRCLPTGGFLRERRQAQGFPHTPGVHQPAPAVAFGVLVLKEGHDLAPRQGQVQGTCPIDVACHLVQLARAIPAQKSLHLAFSPREEWLGRGGTEIDRC